MPVPDMFTIAPDFTVCEYCNKTYADTADNMHRIKVEKRRKIKNLCCLRSLYRESQKRQGV